MKDQFLWIVKVLFKFNGLCRLKYSSFIGNIYRKLPKTPSIKIAVLITPLILVGGFIMYGYFIPTSQVFGKVYFQGPVSPDEIALTFDDGPNDPYTSQILDVLEAYNVKATFFEIGKNVELYPQTSKRLLADGDVIGNHSYSHSANHALTLFGVNDMRRGEEAIYNALGVKPRLYRPPHGRLSPWEIHYVHAARMVEVTWNVETLELAGRSGAQEGQDIVKKALPGDIILLHDGYGTEHNDKHADKTATVEAVKIIIPQLLAKGYTFVTVPELLGVTPYLN
jgi:peptidoglycan/xylan/chitin deacetylase (PgdA/CDA1 family)